MELHRARQALGRAQRMLEDLGRHADDETAFRDRLPYVLDLMAGVTRTINSESEGHRNSQFRGWWDTTDRTTQNAIQDLRNAELKRSELRSEQKVVVEMRPYGGTSALPNTLTEGEKLEVASLYASQFSISVSTEWRFVGGYLDGQAVLPTLIQYWNQVGEVMLRAEELLSA